MIAIPTIAETIVAATLDFCPSGRPPSNFSRIQFPTDQHNCSGPLCVCISFGGRWSGKIASQSQTLARALFPPSASKTQRQNASRNRRLDPTTTNPIQRPIRFLAIQSAAPGNCLLKWRNSRRPPPPPLYLSDLAGRDALSLADTPEVRTDSHSTTEANGNNEWQHTHNWIIQSFFLLDRAVRWRFARGANGHAYDQKSSPTSKIFSYQ